MREERLLLLCGGASDNRAGETDLMAQLPALKKKSKLSLKRGKVDVGEAVSVYSITDRNSVLEGLDGPPITAQECERRLGELESAANKAKRLPFEVAWRSGVCAPCSSDGADGLRTGGGPRVGLVGAVLWRGKCGCQWILPRRGVGGALGQLI